MASSGFWRLSLNETLRFKGVPSEVQRLPRSYGMREKVRNGHGLLVGDLDEESQCGEVRWLASVEGVDLESETFKLNWRPADITLKPTASGASFWRRKPWFGFAPDVADRYMLDGLFADVFDDESWSTSSVRVELSESGQETLAGEVGKPIEPHHVFAVAKPSKHPRVGYVYLVWSHHGYKIGKSVNVKQRTRLFSVKLPFDIRVEHYAKFSDYTQAESTLHKHFHSQRLDGEWFELSPSDVALIKTFGEPQSVEGL